jgi:hypothetical protein
MLSTGVRPGTARTSHFTRQDRPRRIDHYIDYFGEPGRVAFTEIPRFPVNSCVCRAFKEQPIEST